MRHKSLGTEGLIVAFLLTGAMSALNFFLGDGTSLSGNMGICLPSPNLWPVPRLWSWIINLGLILLLTPGVYMLNKVYSLIQSTDTIFAAILLVMVGANPWIDSLLCTSTLVLWVNLLTLMLLFNAYNTRNATQQVFVVATMLSLGSMFQYAFLVYVPAYILTGVILKCMRIRELIAFFLGLIAPYWVAIGLGLISLDKFSLPTLSNLFSGYANPEDIFIILVNVAFTALLLVSLGLSNAMKLYAGNTRRRLFNNSILIIGIFSICAIIIDSDNLPSYLGSLYLCAALQTANFFALGNVPKPRLWLTGVASIYIILFILSFTADKL